jgi:hypothetical protein
VTLDEPLCSFRIGLVTRGTNHVIRGPFFHPPLGGAWGGLDIELLIKSNRLFVHAQVTKSTIKTLKTWAQRVFMLVNTARCWEDGALEEHIEGQHPYSP